MADARRPDWVPVARFETRRIVKRGDFLVSLLVMPLIIVGVSFGVNILTKRASRPAKIALVSASPLVVPGQAPFDSIEGIVWVPVAGAAAAPESLARAVDAKVLDGALVVPARFARDDSVRLIVRRSDPTWVRRVREPFRTAARLARAIEGGLAPEVAASLDEPVKLAQTPTRPASGTERADRIAAFALAVLLLSTIYATAAYLSIGITGEKQARATEVIISAIRPQSWMDGKLIAFTAIGLLQIVVWGGSLAAIAISFSWWALPPINPLALAANAAFVALGFAFYVALFAAILATIKDLQSTSKFQAYLYFLPIIPLMFLEPVVENPESTLAVVLSWFPAFSPMLMPTRLALQAAAWWEVVGALVLLLIATHFVRLAAGHAFRIGMLMYGKEASLPEIVRWARAK